MKIYVYYLDVDRLNKDIEEHDKYRKSLLKANYIQSIRMDRTIPPNDRSWDHYFSIIKEVEVEKYYTEVPKYPNIISNLFFDITNDMIYTNIIGNVPDNIFVRNYSCISIMEKEKILKGSTFDDDYLKMINRYFKLNELLKGK